MKQELEFKIEGKEWVEKFLNLGLYLLHYILYHTIYTFSILCISQFLLDFT